MKKKKLFKRIMSGGLTVLLCVTLNIEPVGIIAGALCETEFVKDCGVLYDNLMYLAKNGRAPTSYAAETEGTDGAGGSGGTGETTTLETSDCDCDFSCDAIEAITRLMGGTIDSNGDVLTNGVTMTEINNTLNSIYGVGSDGTGGVSLATIDESIDLVYDAISNNNGSVFTRLDTVNSNLITMISYLENMDRTLSNISSELDGMTHDYRVAHLHSLNNSVPKALWRPSLEEVPGVVDFAYLNGGFANIYSGAWDSFRTPIDKSNEALKVGENAPEGASRTLEVLGYDAVLRREGFIILGELAYCTQHGGDEVEYFAFRDVTGTYEIDCGGRLDSGQLVCPKCLQNVQNDTSKLKGITANQQWKTIIAYEQEPIPADAVTWFDAVTLLYKALGQETVTYRSFLYHNKNITPNNSPAYQNLSNIDGFDSYDYEYETVTDYMYVYEYDANGNKVDKNGDGVINVGDRVILDKNGDGQITNDDKCVETRVAKDQDNDGEITEKDKVVLTEKVYQGYDYKVFATRSNVYTGLKLPGAEIENVRETAKGQAFDVYWNRALNDGFVLDENKNRNIYGQEFFQLCQRMMETYGEPVLNQDEVDALLQVYGADYPIQLGTEIADAWAYLKVRGCLDVDIPYTGTVTRDALLDVAMRIKDEDSRTDYKNINITLDLSDVMISDGYYPVEDLNIVEGDFSATTTFNYAESAYFDLLVPYDESSKFKATNSLGEEIELTNLFAYTYIKGIDDNYKYYIPAISDVNNRKGYFGRDDDNSNTSNIIQNINPMDEVIYKDKISIGENNYYHFKIKTDIALNSEYGANNGVRVSAWGTDANGDLLTTCTNFYIEIPNTHWKGGIVQDVPVAPLSGSVNIAPDPSGSGGGTVNYSGSKYTLGDLVPFSEFDYSNSANQLLKMTDAQRAGRADEFTQAYLPEDPTLLEYLCYQWDRWTTPMVAKAAEPTQQSGGSAPTTVKIGFNNIENSTDPVIQMTFTDGDSGQTWYSSKFMPGATDSNSATAYMYRLVTAFENSDFKSAVNQGLSTDSLKEYIEKYKECADMTPMNPPTPLSGFCAGAFIADLNYENNLSDTCATFSPDIDQDGRRLGSNTQNTAIKLSYAKTQWFLKLAMAMGGINTFDHESWLNNEEQAAATSNIDPPVGVVSRNLFDDYGAYDASILKYEDNNPDEGKARWAEALYAPIFNGNTNGVPSSIVSYDGYSSYVNRMSGSYDILKEDWDEIIELIDACGITNVTQDSDKTISITCEDSAALMSKLGEMLADDPGYSAGMSDNFAGHDVSTLLDTTVASSSIMNREENILILWEDLLKAGFVIDTFDGRNPEPDVNGVYHIQTTMGSVKVNNGAHTMMVGNTYYNLDDNGNGPTLVYLLPGESEGDKDRFYLDYRCIMGLSAQNIRRDDDQTSVIQTEGSVGVGKSVVYNLIQGEVDSAMFTSVGVATYNWPDAPNIVNGCNTGNFGYYKTNIITETMYDGEDIVNGTMVGNSPVVKYWDGQSGNMRMAMSSFCPMSNWVVVTRQNDTDVGSYLYVWYPRVAFTDGYVDFDGQKHDPVPYTGSIPEGNWTSMADEAVNETLIYDGQSFKSVWEKSCAGEQRIQWFDQMTRYAAAKLYDETNGGYFLSKDYVIRRFDITENSCTVGINSWTGYAQTGNSTIDEVDHDNDPATPAERRKNYAMYWLEGIGFVYNIPNLSDFTLQDYFEGRILLPLAYDGQGAVGGSISIVNFNTDYYYQAITDINGVRGTKNVPYGVSLSAKGYIDPAGNTWDGLDNTVLEGYMDQGNNASGDNYPYALESGSGDYGFVYAPNAVYTVLGGMTPEYATTKDLTGYVTSANYVYDGGRRLTFEKSDNGEYYFYRGVGDYPSVKVPAEAIFRRAYHSTYDVLVNHGTGVTAGMGGNVASVNIYDTYPNPIQDLLDRWGMTSLLNTIDSGASLIIQFAFQVLPLIGLIFMTILIGLSFLGDIQAFQFICDKLFDPVRLLTLGNRDIHTWSWRRVLIPCMLFFISFALFMNGNIIRIIMFIAEFYGTIMRMAQQL